MEDRRESGRKCDTGGWESEENGGKVGERVGWGMVWVRVVGVCVRENAGEQFAEQSGDDVAAPGGGGGLNGGADVAAAGV